MFSSACLFDTKVSGKIYCHKAIKSLLALDVSFQNNQQSVGWYKAPIKPMSPRGFVAASLDEQGVEEQEAWREILHQYWKQNICALTWLAERTSLSFTLSIFMWIDSGCLKATKRCQCLVDVPWLMPFKVGVGSLFLMSSGQNFHNNLAAFCNSGGLKKHYISASLLGSVFRPSRDIFSQSR